MTEAVRIACFVSAAAGMLSLLLPGKSLARQMKFLLSLMMALSLSVPLLHTELPADLETLTQMQTQAQEEQLYAEIAAETERKLEAVLREKLEEAGITVTELAYDYAKTKGAISQILKKLIEKGIILQKPSQEQGDKRIFLFLTPAGEKLNEAHVRYDESHAGETLDRVRLEFTDEQFDTAFDVIQCWLKCRRIVHEERRLAREGRQKED